VTARAGAPASRRRHRLKDFPDYVRADLELTEARAALQRLSIEISELERVGPSGADRLEEARGDLWILDNAVLQAEKKLKRVETEVTAVLERA
jgi:hypothetical protein